MEYQWISTKSISGQFLLSYVHKWYDLIDSVTDVEVYGQVLYTYFVLQFCCRIDFAFSFDRVIYLTNNFNKIKATDQSILSKSHVILLLLK
jgi:hypothetical protein